MALPVTTLNSEQPVNRTITWLILTCVVLTLLVLIPMAIWSATATSPPDDSAQPGTTPDQAAGNQKRFSSWSKDRQPDLVLLLSGQTYGYLSPCGCSQPQKGGLERRFNLVDQLRKRGWDVVGLDLGDISAPKGLHTQNLLKYKTAMQALNLMGYQAIGLGEYDFASQIFDLLSTYTLNNLGKPPVILASNLLGVQRDSAGNVSKAFSLEEFFPGAEANDRPMIDDCAVITRPNLPAIGVVGVIGPTTADRIVSMDKQFDFARNLDGQAKITPAITAALLKLAAHPAKPTFKVLLFVGKIAEAQEVAKQFPEFQMILCQSDDSEPPTLPTQVNDGRTQIVQVGHKGQSVGLMGLYRKGNEYQLHYQLVTLTEDFLTPDDEEVEKNHPLLKLLESYTQSVKDQNLLALYEAKKIQHASQVQYPSANLSYIGSQACARCHAAEYAVWTKSKHSHAYEALEKYAKRPSNRQFDGECLVCHTTGMDYKTGFSDAVKTPHLMNNGCENCHGPGSGHAANPTDKALLAALSRQWKSKPTDKLPPPETLEEIAKLPILERHKVKLTVDQRNVIDNVYNLCARCHDAENDPKFDIYEYMPKIYHSNLGNKGLPAGVK